MVEEILGDERRALEVARPLPKRLASACLLLSALCFMGRLGYTGSMTLVWIHCVLPALSVLALTCGVGAFLTGPQPGLAKYILYALAGHAAMALVVAPPLASELLRLLASIAIGAFLVRRSRWKVPSIGIAMALFQMGDSLIDTLHTGVEHETASMMSPAPALRERETDEGLAPNADSVRAVEEGCDAPYNLTHHGDTGKLDICTIEHTLGQFKVLTNWGTKPEWLNERQLVFLSNQIGNVYLMDLEEGTVRNLTGQFAHAGYTRAHKLNTGDLLLVGPTSGPRPPNDPLVIYDEGQFVGSLWVFESPFDRPPYLLKMKTAPGPMETIPAWEGIAVSRETSRIVWSDTRTAFFGSTIIETGWNYFFEPSNLWMGEFVHRPGASYINEPKKLLSKYSIGAVFLEPQNFVGKDDNYVSFSAYGPSSTGSGNTFLYDVGEDRVMRIHIGQGYEEWEGVAPDYQRSFVENEADASRFVGPQAVELHLHDFATHQTTRFSFFRDDHQRDDGFYLHEPVFSPDGTHALFATGGGGGWEINSPGYGIGIVLLDLEDYLEPMD